MRFSIVLCTAKDKQTHNNRQEAMGEMGGLVRMEDTGMHGCRAIGRLVRGVGGDAGRLSVERLGGRLGGWDTMRLGVGRL